MSMHVIQAGPSHSRWSTYADTPTPPQILTPTSICFLSALASSSSLRSRDMAAISAEWSCAYLCLAASATSTETSRCSTRELSSYAHERVFGGRQAWEGGDQLSVHVSILLHEPYMWNARTWYASLCDTSSSSVDSPACISTASIAIGVHCTMLPLKVTSRTLWHFSYRQYALVDFMIHECYRTKYS